MTQHLRECGPDLGVGEAEAEFGEAARYGPLAGGDDHRHLAVEELEGERGNGQQGWTVKDAAQRTRELGVVDRVRRGHVQRSGRAVVLDAVHHGRRHVVDVNPGNVLAATGDWASDAGAEEWQHLGQRASAPGKHDSGTHNRHTAMLLGSPRLLLPVANDTRQEVVTWVRLLVELLAASRTVVAGR